MITHSKATLLLFIMLSTMTTALSASEKQQKESVLYPKDIQKNELPGSPSDDFLQTVAFFEILKKQPFTPTYWRYEYKTNTTGESRLSKSYFYHNNEITIYTHKLKLTRKGD